MKKWKFMFLIFVVLLFAAGCSQQDSLWSKNGNGSEIENSSEAADSEDTHTENDLLAEAVQDTSAENPENATAAPTKEQVLAAREIALDGMTQEQIDRLTENIKVANLAMERAYLQDDIFGKLEDENSLFWNYFDEKGDIQISWTYDGDYSEINKICRNENLAIDEFYEKYGTPVTTYNRFDADNFIELIGKMQESVQNEKLRADLQALMDEAALARDTHDVEYANQIYKVLHDMDYFLLRYGLEDVGAYVTDDSLLATYYGVLTIYQ